MGNSRLSYNQDIALDKERADNATFSEQTRKVPCRVLIVEDEPAMAELIMELLTSRGYKVKRTGSADEALTVMHESKQDMLIVDLELPDKHGLVLLENLQQAGDLKGVSVVVLTGQESPILVKYAGALGATAYLSKRFPASEILETIDAVAESRGQ